MGTGASHNDCELMMQNRRCLRVLDNVIILYIFGILQYRYILLYVGNRVIMDTQGMEPFGNSVPAQVTGHRAPEQLVRNWDLI